jgi:hypothetical protein
MYFFYLDSKAEIHVAALPHLKQPIVDIDLQLLNFGHKVFPQRLHGLDCFEKIARDISEDHQFTYRYWYDGRARSTHCIWYSVPKIVLNRLPEQCTQTHSFAFMLMKFFPPSCRNKSVICFVALPGCEAVVGYVQGHCVCFKKLPPKQTVNVQQEWQYIQQAYPQWNFEHSIYFSPDIQADNALTRTHQHTIHVDSSSTTLNNRIKLYGLD